MRKTNPVKHLALKLRSRLLGPLLSLEPKVDRALATLDYQGTVLERLGHKQQQTKQDIVGAIAISETEVVTKLFNDLIMYLDPRDIAVAPHIILERIWERETTWAWLNIVDNLHRKDAVIFDVGANFGYFALLAAQRVDKKKANIVLFEPNSNLLPYINKTLSVNWFNENTVVENLGVGAKRGSAKLNILEHYIGSSSMQTTQRLNQYMGRKMHAKAEQTVEVPIVSIDEYCKDHSIDRIDLMKMDIEGYEENAYQGMREMVKKSPEMVLFIEFTKAAYTEPEKFYNQLRSDFKHVYTVGATGKLLAPKNTSYTRLVKNADVLIFLVFSKKSLRSVKP